MNNMLTLDDNTVDSASTEQQHATAIVCTPVPDEQRIAFWPQHFGSIPQWIILEPAVFAWMERSCEHYNGRHLEFLYSGQRWGIYGSGH